jgi:hypothetical protein
VAVGERELLLPDRYLAERLADGCTGGRTVSANVQV